MRVKITYTRAQEDILKGLIGSEPIDWKTVIQDNPVLSEFTPKILKQKFFQMKKKMINNTASCTKCGFKMTELKLMKCSCDFPTITIRFIYIIQEKQYISLVDPIEFIGISNNSMELLETWPKEKYNMYYSFREINEMITLLSPKKSSNAALVNVKCNVSCKNINDTVHSRFNPSSESFIPGIGIIASTISRINNAFRKIGDTISGNGHGANYSNYTAQSRILEYNLEIPVGHTIEFYRSVIVRNTGISESTRQSYIVKIEALWNKEIFQHLNNSVLVLEFLSTNYCPTTVKSYISIIRVFLVNLKNSEKKTLGIIPGLGDEYSEILYKLKNNLHEITLSQQKNATESECWIPWETILSILDLIPRNTQEYLAILLLLKQQTLRNDYCTLGLTAEYLNYIDLGAPNMKFIWQDYKTAKFHGKLEFDVKEDVKNELLSFIELRKKEGRNFLFMNAHGKMMTKAQFSIMVRETFKKYLNVPIGVQMLRKIKVSTIRGNDISHTESELLAHEMMHTSDISRLNYRKI